MTQFVEGHIIKRYDGELSVLHLLLTEMGALVSSQVDSAMGAVKKHIPDAAQEIIERDIEVDQLEIKIDAEIEALVAKRTPIAKDLRLVLGCSKIVSELEKIGDEAVHCATIAHEMFEQNHSRLPKDMFRQVFQTMKTTRRNVRDAIEVIDTLDTDLAQTLIEDTREIEAEFPSSLRIVVSYLLEDTRNVGKGVSVVQVIKCLERISSHARTIAEHIIYIRSGEDIRHNNQAIQEANS